MEEEYWRHARECSQWAAKAKGRDDCDTFLSIAFRDLEITFTTLALRASAEKAMPTPSGMVPPRLRVIEGSRL
jgi:hypothetical protein